MILVIIRVQDFDYSNGKTYMEKIISFLKKEKLNIEHDINGAPYIKGKSNMNISVSHSKNYYCLVLSENYKVGLDVEEFYRLNRSTYPISLFEKWMMFEAVSKTARTGIKGDFRDFSKYTKDKFFILMNFKNILKIVINIEKNKI